MIQSRAKQGIYLKDIAAELGISQKTVSRALKRGSEPRGKPGRPKISLLEPYYDQINQMLADDIWNARVIWRELRLQGFSGCESTVRN